MIEVYPKLFVGNERDYECSVSHQRDWAVVHACKEPYHRQALGYTGRGAPKSDPEYLVAHRGNRLMLNIVDTDNPLFFDKGMINQALDFIDQQRANELKVLVHCNQGESRGPSVTMLYMAARLRVLPADSLESAEQKFKELYASYFPGMGIRGHLRQYWQQYCE
ncbi:MAG: dual specificity protein phosphatase family protein [Ktedonobacteraceae bacterium]